MWQFIARRIIMLIPVVLLVTTATFMVMRVLPSDLAYKMLGDYATPDRLQEMREQLGLLKPIHVQYADWLLGVVRGDLGTSPLLGQTVFGLIVMKLGVTAQLAVMAVFFSLLISIPIAVLSAARPDGWIDYVGRLLSIGGIAMPGFWLGTLAVITPSILFNYASPGYVPLLDDPARNLEQMIPPSIILGFALSAVLMRMTRSTLLEVLRADYIRTAHAKGLRERTVIYRHALKNALIPVVTISGLQLSALLGGSVIMEQIYGLPGIGRLALVAISGRDYPVVQGVVLMMAIIYVVMNLLVDISYAWLDPRVRYQ